MKKYLIYNRDFPLLFLKVNPDTSWEQLERSTLGPSLGETPRDIRSASETEVAMEPDHRMVWVFGSVICCVGTVWLEWWKPGVLWLTGPVLAITLGTVASTFHVLTRLVH
jgi:hypothetical protein